MGFNLSIVTPGSLAAGVRQYPAPVPLVRCAGVVSADNSPRRIIPQRGKVTEHDIESSGNKEG